MVWCTDGAFTQAEADAESPSGEADAPQGEHGGSRLTPLRGHFGMTALTATPFGGARSAADWGYGLALYFGASWGKIPISFGMDLMLARWGSTTTRRSLDLGDQVVDVSLRHSDQTVFYDLWLRLQPPDYIVRPYAEALVGFKGLFTEYTLGFVDGVGLTSTTSDQVLTSSVGFGAGVDVFLSQNDSGARLYATLGFRWLHGGRASFSRSVARVAGDKRSASFDVATTTTIVILGIAVTWDLLGGSRGPEANGRSASNAARL